MGDGRIALEVVNLHVSIEGKKILKGVDLKVPYGEVHAIMGPNGSGKSTLAYVIAGHPAYTVEEGDILLDGGSIVELSPDERAQRGLFLGFQHPIEINGVSMVEFLRIAINEQRKARGEEPLNSTEFLARLKALARELFGSEEYIYRSVNEGFSGGERKRNEVLQMLMLEPRVAVLDETDSGLDIDALKLVAKGINSLRGEERAILLITHYYRILEYVKPDRVHVLYNGRIVESGPPELAHRIEREGYEAVVG